MGFAKGGASDGVVFAGVAGGRGGSADGHNGDCTRPGRVKKAASCKGKVAGGGTAVSPTIVLLILWYNGQKGVAAGELPAAI